MEDYKQEFFDQYKQEDDEGFYSTLESRRQLYSYIDTNYISNMGNEGNILELGCGFGTFIYFLEQNGYTKLTGVDASKGQIENGTKKVKGKLIAGDALEVLKDIEDESLDCIVMIDVLEHIKVDYVSTLFRTLATKLKKGGRFITHQPNALSPIVGSVLMGDLTHEFAYTPELISLLGKSNGYSNVSFSECGPYVHGIKSMVRLLLWKLIVKPMIRMIYLVDAGGCIPILTRNFYAVLVK